MNQPINKDTPIHILDIPTDLACKLVRLTHNPNMRFEDLPGYLTTPDAPCMLGQGDFQALQSLVTEAEGFS